MAVRVHGQYLGADGTGPDQPAACGASVLRGIGAAGCTQPVDRYWAGYGAAPYAGLPTVPTGACTAATAGASSQRTGACRPASGLAASSAYSVPRSFASRACTTFEDMDPVLSGTGHLACAWC